MANALHRSSSRRRMLQAVRRSTPPPMTRATPNSPPEIRYGISWYWYALWAAPYQPSRMQMNPKTIIATPMTSSQRRMFGPPRRRVRSTTAARRPSRFSTGVALACVSVAVAVPVSVSVLADGGVPELVHADGPPSRRARRRRPRSARGAGRRRRRRTGRGPGRVIDPPVGKSQRRRGEKAEKDERGADALEGGRQRRGGQARLLRGRSPPVVPEGEDDEPNGCKGAAAARIAGEGAGCRARVAGEHVPSRPRPTRTRAQWRRRTTHCCPCPP